MSGDYPYASPPEAKTWQAPWPPADLPTAGPAVVLPLEHIVAGMMLVLSAGNILMVPIADSIHRWNLGVSGLAIVMAIAGSIGAQGALLTILVAFGGGPLWQRLVWHWALAVAALAAWSLGYAMIEWQSLERNPINQEFLTAVLAMPLLAVCCQAAPWLLRVYSRWRIEGQAAPAGDGQSRSRATEPRLAIRDVLAATVIAAASLAAARVGKPPLVSHGEYWAILLSLLGAAAVVMVVGGLPIMYLLLGARRWQWGISGILAIAATAALLFAVVLDYLPGGPTRVEKTAVAAALVWGFVFPLAGTLLLARMYGYRLVRCK